MYNYTPSQYDESKEVIQSYVHDKLLTREEEKELFHRYNNEDDQQAREELIKYNMRLVINIANDYKGFDGAEMADLIQVGSIGLMAAIDRFKPEMNNKFSTYSYYWIEQKINRHIHDTCSMIRVPIHQREKLERINKAYSFLYKKYGRKPNKEEVSEFTDFSIDEIEDLSSVNSNLINNTSIHTTPSSMSGSKKESELLEILFDKKKDLTDEKAIKENIEREMIMKLIERVLKEREQYIIKERFGFTDGDSKTLERIGNILDLSRGRIRQIEEKSMNKLKRHVRYNDNYRDLR